jgi:NADPH:quinone reductase
MLRGMLGWQMQRTGNPAEVLTLADLPTPKPAEGELTVDIEYAGLGFADLLLIRGEYQVALPLPAVPGSEFVGRVAAAGPGTTLAPGTRVLGLSRWGHGPLAVTNLAIENQVEPIADELPGPETVSLIGNYVTAHLALHRRARLQSGEVVVVHGAAGGVGAAAVQLAKAAGATVLAADLGADRAGSCLAMGADVAVDATDPARLTDAVREHTGGRGADVVLDMVGGDLFEAARRYIAYEGRIVIVGFTSGTIPQLRVNQLLLRSFAVLGVNALTVLERYPAVHAEARRAVVDLLARGAIAPPVADVRPLGELVELLDALATRTVTGKAVIRVQGS